MNISHIIKPNGICSDSSYQIVGDDVRMDDTSATMDSTSAFMGGYIGGNVIHSTQEIMSTRSVGSMILPSILGRVNTFPIRGRTI